jgi:integrase
MVNETPENDDPNFTSMLCALAKKGEAATFRDVYECIWLPRKRATISSWKPEARRIENVLLPKLGDIPLKDITPQMVIPCLADYENKIPSLQRLCMRVNEIMNYGLCADLIDRNRCEKMRVIYPHRKSDHQPTIPASELPTFFSVLTLNDDKGPLPIWFKLMVIYQLYSMARCNEVVGLKWEYIHEDTIVIPAEQMKGRRPHRIWLCPEMMEVMKILYVLGRDKKSPYVFPFSKSVTGHVHPQCFTKWIQHSSLGGMVIPHGLRATGRTWLRDMGCSNEIGEDFLSHVYGTPTERAYIRSDYLEQRKPYYQRWYDYLKNAWFLSQAVDGPEQISSSKTNMLEELARY